MGYPLIFLMSNDIWADVFFIVDNEIVLSMRFIYSCLENIPVGLSGCVSNKY